VVRNRWKRAIREAFRLNRHRLRDAHDVVVSVDWDVPPEAVGRVPGAFDELIQRLNRPPSPGGEG
jgi:ribonuclease P protein component